MKIYLSRINESWIVDRIRNEWYLSNSKISTKYLRKSDIVWIVSPWLWKNVPKRFLEETGSDLNPSEDRVMICGSIAMLNEFKDICLEKGFKEGSNSSPGQFVIEKAFVD